MCNDTKRINVEMALHALDIEISRLLANLAHMNQQDRDMLNSLSRKWSYLTQLADLKLQKQAI